MTLTRKLVIAGLILIFPIYIGTLFIPRADTYQLMWFEVTPLILSFVCLFTALILWIATGGKRKEH